VKVAIQGIEGSFHEEAAHNLVPDAEICPMANFQEVFEAVKDGTTSYGVSAIENSLHGSINAVYRLLDRYDLWIAGETSLHIEQFLIGGEAADLTALNTRETRVLSQAPALAQVELWLDNNLPRARREETGDTAESVKTVLENGESNLVAVAGKRAAELYGGKILAGPINDDPNNYTRFVLLTREETIPADANRTSMILTTDHSPGALYNALGIFATHELNMSKLDSHPIPTDKRHYAFYIDVEAGAAQNGTKAAIEELQSHGYTVKILGSYHVQD
jgi:prephenate dehydratase